MKFILLIWRGHLREVLLLVALACILAVTRPHLNLTKTKCYRRLLQGHTGRMGNGISSNLDRNQEPVD